MKPTPRIVIASLALACAEPSVEGPPVPPPSGTWSTLAGGPLARLAAGNAWPEGEFIAWGGTFSNCSPPKCQGDTCTKVRDCSDGGRLDLKTLKWTRMSMAGAPAPRSTPVTLAVGTRVLFFGGNDDGIANVGPDGSGGIIKTYSLDDGAIYDLKADSWQLLPSAPAGPRKFAAAVTDGRQALIWGGYAEKLAKDLPDSAGWAPTDIPEEGDGPILSKTFSGGWRLDLDTRVWTPMSTLGAPGLSAETPLVTWATDRMLVMATEGGAAYDPRADTWTPVSTAGMPAPRPTAGDPWAMPRWIGLMVEGSNDRLLVLGATAAFYDPRADAWEPVQSILPSFSASVPAGKRIALWASPASRMTPGWLFDTATGKLAPLAEMSPYIPALVPRAAPALAWTGDKLVVWGGGVTDDKLSGPAVGAAVFSPMR